jgi:hypothetical protein
MNANEVLEKGAGVGLMVGVAGVLSSQAARADERSLGPLAGGDTAVILSSATRPLRKPVYGRISSRTWTGYSAPA